MSNAKKQGAPVSAEEKKNESTLTVVTLPTIDLNDPAQVRAYLEEKVESIKRYNTLVKNREKFMKSLKELATMKADAEMLQKSNPYEDSKLRIYLANEYGNQEKMHISKVCVVFDFMNFLETSMKEKIKEIEQELLIFQANV